MSCYFRLNVTGFDTSLAEDEVEEMARILAMAERTEAIRLAKGKRTKAARLAKAERAKAARLAMAEKDKAILSEGNQKSIMTTD
ncbi:unnamed protein product [Brassica oleracea var. botrytis]